MTKPSIKNSFFLKALSYIFLPIIIASLILSIIYISLSNQYGKSDNLRTSYFSSSEFAYEYISNILSNVRRINAYKDDSSNGIYSKIEDNIYYTDNSNTYNDITSYIKYIIIDNDTNTIYTNYQSTNYIEDAKKFSTNNFFWIYDNKAEISTDIDILSNNKIKYFLSNYEDISYLSKYSIYSFLDIENFEFSNYIKVRLYSS